MALSLDAAAEVFREAMRDTVKRYSLWYLIQGVLLIAAGVLAIIYPVISSAYRGHGVNMALHWSRRGRHHLRGHRPSRTSRGTPTLTSPHGPRTHLLDRVSRQ